MLIEKGADIHYTAPHEVGYISALSFLLLILFQGMSSLYYASQRGLNDVVMMLIKKGANVNSACAKVCNYFD